jgi:hypothetical protein
LSFLIRPSPQRIIVIDRLFACDHHNGDRCKYERGWKKQFAKSLGRPQKKNMFAKETSRRSFSPVQLGDITNRSRCLVSPITVHPWLSPLWPRL